MESVSGDDLDRLFVYMPDEIDSISVPRDLLLITTQSGALYQNAGYVGMIDNLFVSKKDRANSNTNNISHIPVCSLF